MVTLHRHPLSHDKTPRLSHWSHLVFGDGTLSSRQSYGLPWVALPTNPGTHSSQLEPLVLSRQF